MKSFVTEIKEIKTEIRLCDICEKKAEGRTCLGCRKDLCEEHKILDYNNAWAGDSNGDYPDIYCHDCYNALEPYRIAARIIIEEADEKIEVLEREWAKVCLERVNK